MYMYRLSHSTLTDTYTNKPTYTYTPTSTFTYEPAYTCLVLPAAGLTYPSMYLRTHAHICFHLYTHTHIQHIDAHRTYIHAHAHTYTPSYAHTYTPRYAYIHVHACIQAHAHLCISYHTAQHVHTNSLNPNPKAPITSNRKLRARGWMCRLSSHAPSSPGASNLGFIMY